MSGPLAGFRCLDASRLIPGPTATWMLGDLGMDIIKIEECAVLEAGRTRDPMYPRNNDTKEEERAVAWNHLSRNKRSLALNLQTDEGQAILRKLVESADVFFASYNPPVYKKLKVDYESLSKINPRLVYCTLSGYGIDSSMANIPGNENNARALAGVSGLTRNFEDEPVDPGFLVVNGYASAMVVVAVQAALLARSRTGKGQAIDIAQTDSATGLVNLPIARYLKDGEKRLVSKRGVDYLRCKDGMYIATAAWAQERWWSAFCDVIERPQYKNAPRRYQYLKDQEAAADIRAVMMTKTRDEWLAIIPKNITVVPVLEIDELADGAFAKERGLVWELDHPTEGKVRQYGSPLHFSDTPVEFRSFAPLLGEHTAEVLGELGYSASEIDALDKQEVVRTAESYRRNPPSQEKAS